MQSKAKRNEKKFVVVGGGGESEMMTRKMQMIWPDVLQTPP